jgi:hypothetical protein
MMHARWQIDARFGHKQDVIERLPRDAAPQAGLNTSHLLTGSIGALEATVEHTWHVESLADLERRRGSNEGHTRGRVGAG